MAIPEVAREVLAPAWQMVRDSGTQEAQTQHWEDPRHQRKKPLRKRFPYSLAKSSGSSRSVCDCRGVRLEVMDLGRRRQGVRGGPVPVPERALHPRHLEVRRGRRLLG